MVCARPFIVFAYNVADTDERLITTSGVASWRAERDFGLITITTGKLIV